MHTKPERDARQKFAMTFEYDERLKALNKSRLTDRRIRGDSIQAFKFHKGEQLTRCKVQEKNSLATENSIRGTN